MQQGGWYKHAEAAAILTITAIPRRPVEMNVRLAACMHHYTPS